MGAWEITRKDLLLLIKDKRALFLLLALPLVVVSILGTTTGKLLNTEEAAKLAKMGVVDHDNTELSARVIENLKNVGGMKVDRIANEDEAELRISKGQLNLLIVLGPKFHEQVEALELGDILDIEHGQLSEGLSVLDIKVSSGASFGTVKDLVAYVVLSASLQAIAPEVARKNRFVAGYLDRLNERRAEEQKTLPAKSESAPIAPGANFVYDQLVPSYTVMFAFFLVNIMAHSFITERNSGTLRRLRAAPIRPVELLLGKTVPFFVISLAQSIILFISGRLLFGMSWGIHPWMLLPVIFTTSMSATALGLLLSTIVRTDSQVSAYANFLLITMAGISGCFTPRDWLPEFMKTISLCTPHAWALISYQQLLTVAHPNLPDVWRACGMMAGFAMLYFAIGCLRFRSVID